MSENKLAEQLASVKESVTEALQKRDGELEEVGKVSKETADQLATATKALDEVKSEYAELKKEYEGSEARLQEVEKRQQRDFDGQAAAKSIGEQFVGSESYQNVIKSGGSTTDKVRVVKDISNGAASGSALVRPDRRPDVVFGPDRNVFVRDLLQVLPTNSDSVEIMRENVFTNNAAIQDGQLSSKPKSDITYDLQTVAIKTMAHHIIASRQVLDDAPRLRGMIDNRLALGLNKLSDDQLLNGDGNGQNFTGMLVDGDVQDVGELPSGTTGAEIPRAMLDHIRKAITKLIEADFTSASAILLNPADFEKLELAKDEDGQYLWVTVPNGAGNQPRIWRVPVVETNAMPADTFLLGDFQQAATVYDREQMNVRTSEHHANLFVENGVAVLGEERIGFGIERPKGLVKGEFTVST